MEFDLKDIKPSVYNWIVTGLMVMSFIVLAKFVVNKYENPLTNAVRPFVNAA
jgi:hypothetical protein